MSDSKDFKGLFITRTSHVRHTTRRASQEQLLELRQHGVAGGTLLRREVAGPEPVHCIWGLRSNTEHLGRWDQLLPEGGEYSKMNIDINIYINEYE